MDCRFPIPGRQRSKTYGVLSSTHDRAAALPFSYSLFSAAFGYYWSQAGASFANVISLGLSMTPDGVLEPSLGTSQAVR